MYVVKNILSFRVFIFIFTLGRRTIVLYGTGFMIIKITIIIIIIIIIIVIIIIAVIIIVIIILLTTTESRAEER